MGHSLINPYPSRLLANVVKVAKLNVNMRTTP
jgi:hypothetical protein